MDAPCNGLGKCGKCKVWVSGEINPASDKEREHLIGEEPGVRLGCMAKIIGDVQIRLFNQKERLKGIEEEQHNLEQDLMDFYAEEQYGVAFDIGTTGISGTLHRMKDGAIVSSCARINP